MKARPRRQRIRLDGPIYALDGQVFSVTIGTSPRAPIFQSEEYGLACVRLLEDLRQAHGNSVYAYCLMPDHVHLLLEVTPDSPLPGFVGKWKSLCYKARRERGNPRPFWQRSFFDRAIRSHEDLREVALYILHNPIRKGLVADFHAYPLCGSLEWEI
jgi:putative transposase